MTSTYRIRTPPVYSKLATAVPNELTARLPQDWQLSQHQVDTYRLLTDRDGPDIVFNTAMTGDGKSLAGQLPSLIAGWSRPLFAMYPTNELIRDQRRQAEQTWRRWGQLPDTVVELDSEVLDRTMESQDFPLRGEALLSLLRNHDAVLTNPDIFHYIMQGFYVRKGSSGDAPNRVFGPLVARYQQFTFDEFHVYDTPQVVGVLNALLLIIELTRGHRRQFLFQSATPNELMVEYLDRAGLSYEIVQGRYAHGWQPPGTEHWRRILHGCDIEFSEGTVESWLDLHLEDTLLPFFQKHGPGAKGAIIVNSVAQAKRIVQHLRSVLAPFGLTIGENTGFTSREQRARSYACDLLVGTSTVDVGVDFQINFLLFESRDAGSFLQRLGRLGRHDGYRQEGEFHQFHAFEAHAVLPPWTLETLFVGKGHDPALLADRNETTREELTQSVQSAYPPVTNFEAYARTWGGLQSARILIELRRPPVRDQYSETLQSLGQGYQRVFHVNMNQQLRRYIELANSDKRESVLLEEAISFRGSATFTCAVLDRTEQANNQIKTYDLLPLIANARLGELSEEAFWRAVQDAGLERRVFERRNPIAFFEVFEFLPERSSYVIKLEHDIFEWGDDKFGVATALAGITVDGPGIPNLINLNRRLRQQPLPALVCVGHRSPVELKQRLRLPLLFPIHSFESRDGIRGVIALGRDALLLHVALQHKGIGCGSGAVIV